MAILWIAIMIGLVYTEKIDIYHDFRNISSKPPFSHIFSNGMPTGDGLIITTTKPFFANIEELLGGKAPQDFGMAFSVFTLNQDFIFSIRIPIKPEKDWAKNEKNMYHNSFQCLKGKAYLYGYDAKPFYPICNRDNRKFIRLWFHREEDHTKVEFTLWSDSSVEPIKEVKILKNLPYIFTISMNGFVQTMRFFTDINQDTLPLEDNCDKTCGRCIGRAPYDCVDCPSWSIPLPLLGNGMVCAGYVNLMGMIGGMIIVIGMTLLIRGCCFSQHFSDKFRCKNHQQPATHIITKCNHLLCNDCLVLLKEKPKKLYCPICSKLAKEMFALSEVSPKNYSKQYSLFIVSIFQQYIV